MGADPQHDRHLSSDQARVLQRQLLGRMLVDPAAVGPVLGTGLDERHIDGPHEAKAMRAIRGLYEAGEHVSPGAVVGWLQARGRGDSGLEGALGMLCADPLQGVPGPVAEVFLDEWHWHRLGQVSTILARATRDRRWGPLEVRRQLLDKLDELVPHRRTAQTAAELLDALMPIWRGEEEPAEVISTGLPSLDEKLAGGLRTGQLATIAAASSIGKSALATAIVDATSVRGKLGCGLWSLEMPGVEYVQRVVGGRTGINLTMLGGPLEGAKGVPWADVAEATADLSTAPLWVYDSPGWSAADIRSEVQRRIGDGLRIVVIDQLDKLTHPHRDRHDLRLVATTSALKSLALEFGIVVVLLHQLNSKKLADRKGHRPTLDDLRDGPIQNDCDVVLLLNRPEWWLRTEGKPVPAKLKGVMEAFVAKQRNGPTGWCVLDFDAPSARVRERDSTPKPTKYAGQNSFFETDDDEDEDE